ncbi:MAG: hypothetical protein MUD01_20320 [Chloroflexaceae bacterium]|nr:hypothetical protein [Chloroflexaceae bacterium]
MTQTILTPNRRVGLILGLLLLACYSYFFQFTGWNQTSRMALIMSAVNHGTFNINAYEEQTGDKALFEGNYYSDKAFGTSLFGAPVYAGLRQMQNFAASQADDTMRYPMYVVSVAVVALPSALLAVLLYALLVRLIGSRPWAVALALLYGLGTMAFPFATMFFGHQTATFFVFAAFYLLFQARTESPTTWRLLLAGTLGGLAVITEYQVVLIVALLFLYAASFVRPWPKLGWYVLGGLPWAVLLLAFNYVTLGHPLRFAYQYVSNPDFAGMKEGIFGITIPQWNSFVQIMFSSQGLLFQSLFFVLLPLGAWLMWRGGQWRRELVLCLTIGVLFILWNSAYYLPLGGGTPGPRFLIPSLPFLMLPLAFVVTLARPWAWPVRAALLLTGTWSIAIGFLISSVNPMVPYNAANPYTDHWLALFSQEQFLLNLGTVRFQTYGLMSLVPLLLLAILAADGLFHALRTQERQHRGSQFAELAAMVVLYLIIAFPITLWQPFQVPLEFLRS